MIYPSVWSKRRLPGQLVLNIHIVLVARQTSFCTKITFMLSRVEMEGTILLVLYSRKIRLGFSLI